MSFQLTQPASGEPAAPDMSDASLDRRVHGVIEGLGVAGVELTLPVVGRLLRTMYCFLVHS